MIRVEFIYGGYIDPLLEPYRGARFVRVILVEVSEFQGGILKVTGGVPSMVGVLVLLID